MEILERNGCIVTQATLSRDLKSLRTSKVSTDLGGYRYVIAANGTAADEVATHAMNTVRQAAILSVTVSGSLVIIKTRNGYAGGVAYDIDEVSRPTFSEQSQALTQSSWHSATTPPRRSPPSALRHPARLSHG